MSDQSRQIEELAHLLSQAQQKAIAIQNRADELEELHTAIVIRLAKLGNKQRQPA